MAQIPLSPDVDGVSAVCIRNEAFLLVERGREPAKGWLAFPGGRREDGEAPDSAAIRELFEPRNFPPPGPIASRFSWRTILRARPLPPTTRRQSTG